MDGIAQELAEIGKIIAEAHLVDAIRREAHAAVGSRASVMTGELANAPQYDFVVVHKGGADAGEAIGRRLRGSIEGIEVSQIERIADGVVGINRRKT